MTMSLYNARAQQRGGAEPVKGAQHRATEARTAEPLKGAQHKATEARTAEPVATLHVAQLVDLPELHGAVELPLVPAKPRRQLVRQG